MAEETPPTTLEYGRPPRRYRKLILITCLIAVCVATATWFTWDTVTGWATERWDIWTQYRIEQRALAASPAEGTYVYGSALTSEGPNVLHAEEPAAIAEWHTVSSDLFGAWPGRTVVEGAIWSGMLRDTSGAWRHVDLAMQHETRFGDVDESLVCRVWEPGAWNRPATRRLHMRDQLNIENQGLSIARPPGSGELKVFGGRRLADEKTVRFPVAFNGIDGWLEMTLGTENETTFSGMGIIDERGTWHPGGEDYVFFEAEEPGASYETAGEIEALWFDEAGQLVVAQRALEHPPEDPPGIDAAFYWPSRLIDRLVTFDLDPGDETRTPVLSLADSVDVAPGAFGEYHVSPSGSVIFFESTSLGHGDSEPVIVDASTGKISLRLSEDAPHGIGNADRSRFSPDESLLYMPREGVDFDYWRPIGDRIEHAEARDSCYVWNLATGEISLETIETRGERPPEGTRTTGPPQPRPWIAGTIPAMPRWAGKRWSTPLAYAYGPTRTRFVTTDLHISKWSFADDDESLAPKWDNPQLLIVDDVTGQTLFSKPLHDATRIERNASDLVWSADGRHLYVTLEHGAYLTGTSPGDPVIRLILPDKQSVIERALEQALAGNWNTNEQRVRLAASPDGRVVVLARHHGRQIYIWWFDTDGSIRVRGTKVRALPLK